MNNSNNHGASNRIYTTTTNQGLQNGSIQSQAVSGGTQLIQGVSTSQLPTTTTIKTISNPVQHQIPSHHVQTGNQNNLLGTSTILPSGVVCMRQANQTSQQQNRQNPAQMSRVVIGSSHMVASRPASPSITLGALNSQSAPALIVKTDNGYQLLRVGPSTTGGQPISTSTGNQTIRLQTVPATISSNNNIVVNTVNSTNSTQLFSNQPSSTVTASVNQPTGTQIHQTQLNQIQSPQNQSVTIPTSTVVTTSNTQGNTKEKCRKFLGNLIELSTREPKSVEKNVRTLIQDLINATVEPEQFCNKLEQLLNASPQPCLIGFLKKSLPLLRHSLFTKELIIEGIKSPPAEVVGLTTSSTLSQHQVIPKIQAQIRPVNQQIQQTTTIGQTQVRMITSNVQRPGQTTITKQISGGIRLQQNTSQQVTSTTPRVLNSQIQKSSIAQNTQPFTIQNQTSSQIIHKNLQIVKNNVTQGIRSSATAIIRPPNPSVKSSTQLLKNCTGTHVKVGQTHIKPALVNQQYKIQTGIIHHNPNTISTPSLALQQTSAATVTIPVNNSQGVNVSNLNVNNQINNSTSVAVTNASTNKIVTIKAHNNPSFGGKSLGKKKQNFQSPSHFPNIDDKNTHVNSSYFQTSSMYGDDDINDVAAMGGVNLAEESQKILGSTENIGTQIRSCKEEAFLHLPTLQNKIKTICIESGIDEPNLDVSILISHACQERLKNIVEKLAVIAEHRMDILKVDPKYEIIKDVRGQIKFLEELDKAEQKRHEEQEREILLRAAKSRSRLEDPEQAKLKAKAKEMQRAEMEELRQRDANMTALQAIGPRKKPKLENDSIAKISTMNFGSSASNIVSKTTSRPRIKRVNLKDFLFFMEQEKDLSRSELLYKTYLK